MRKSVPFWKILGENGIFSTVLRVPITFPPEKFKGHLLSGMCAPDLKGSQGTFSFYTSDPAKIQKREGGLAIPVEVKDDRIETYLSGPENTMLKKPEEIRLPMVIAIDRAPKKRRSRFRARNSLFKRNTFSPWIRLTFRPGLGIKIKAICQFYVSRIAPHFEMYVTPLNIDPEKPALPISHPFIYSVYLAKLLGSFITLGEANDTWALNEGALSEQAFLELTYANHHEWEGDALQRPGQDKARPGRLRLRNDRQHLAHVLAISRQGPSGAPKNGPAEMGPEVIEDLFVKMDEMIGRVRKSMARKSVLFVMSDHGFKPFRRGVNLNSWLHQNGYLALKRRRGRGSGEWFKDVDWNRTKAYALGLGGLYVNQKGREAQGIVAAGREAKALRAELQKKLTGLEDDATGTAAIDERLRPGRDLSRALSGQRARPDRRLRSGLPGFLGRRHRKSDRHGFRGQYESLERRPLHRPAERSGRPVFEPEDRRAGTLDHGPRPDRAGAFGVEPPAHMDGRSLVIKPPTGRPERSDLMNRRDFMKAGLGAASLLAVGTRSRLVPRAYGGKAAAKKVLVLGFDGMDPRLVTMWMNEGKLPAFKKLAAQGGFQPLGTSIPPQSPVAWSNFITGMNPGGHGIFDFIHRDPKTYFPVFSASETAEATQDLPLGKISSFPSRAERSGTSAGRAFWQILEDHDIPATVFKMPANYPPVADETKDALGHGHARPARLLRDVQLLHDRTPGHQRGHRRRSGRSRSTSSATASTPSSSARTTPS